MSRLPKLKVINPYWDMPVEIREFEQGKYLPFGAGGILIVVEDRVIYSYDELVQLASEKRYQDREFLEVRFVEITGGG